MEFMADCIEVKMTKSRSLADVHAILHFRELGPKPLSVAEVGKSMVMRVRAEHPAGMLDRAPIDFGARRHLADKGDRAVAIGAIGAIDLLDDVEISQMVAVEPNNRGGAPLESGRPENRSPDRPSPRYRPASLG